VREEAVKRCFGQHEMFVKMVDCLFEDSVSVLAEMEAGKAEGNLDKVAKAAHRLKGTVYYLAAGPTLEVAAAIEAHGLAGEWEPAVAAIPVLQERLQLLRENLEAYRTAAGPAAALL
jgi:HPt (histidine-containing phosphotransfer) domain-containing protein